MKKLLCLPAFALVLACGPKGSNKPATIQTTSTGDILVKHPNFEGHLSAKVDHEASKFLVKLSYSGFPDKSAITFNGKTLPIERVGGELATDIDLTPTIGDAPVSALTGATPISISVPFELTFFDKRQKVSSILTMVRPWLELRSCMTSPPCTFPTDTAPNAKPNILVITKADTLGEKIYGAPTKVRDLDWIAFVAATDPVTGQKCKMKALDGVTPGLSEEHALKREAEHITVRDRRTGALLHTRDLIAEDKCPFYADIKMDGPDAGLRAKISDGERNRLFGELRGDITPAPSATSTSTSAATGKQATKKPATKPGTKSR
jgi:hypothetical protein